MNELVEFLMFKDYFSQLSMLLVSISYIVAVYSMLTSAKKRRLKRKEKFIETFIRGLSENTIENYDDLLNVYSGVTQLSVEDLTNKQIMNKWLREVLSKLVNRDIGKDLDNNQLLEIKNKITIYIKANESAFPFTDLPETERNIINDITSYNKLGERDSVDRKINELSSVIITRYELQKKIERLNKWSIPIAIVGLILTVIFGVLPIFIR
ncbi:hypothetical protein [Bacteroides graminisolvens]